MSRAELTREHIVRTVTEALRPLDSVHALWEGGAASFERVDDWSDIDLYALVDDEMVEETVKAIEMALENMSPITQKYDVPHPPSEGLVHAFYRLEDASEYLLIDLAILKLSAPDKYLETEIHGKPVFYFSKSDAAASPRLDVDSLVRRLLERFERIQARFEMFRGFLQKEINRGNWLEALDLYRVLVLSSLVEVLRMKHHPLHYEFQLRYVYSELPPSVIQRLEHLSFVSDEQDLSDKVQESVDWYRRTVSDIDEKVIKRKITEVSSQQARGNGGS